MWVCGSIPMGLCPPTVAGAACPLEVRCLKPTRVGRTAGMGALKPSEINAAFRRLAETARPDAGGSDEHYRRIAEARDALLEQFASAS